MPASRTLLQQRRRQATVLISFTGDNVLDIARYYLNLLAAKTGKGQGLVEYALIIVLISIVSVAIMISLGGSITSVFTDANSKLTAP